MDVVDTQIKKLLHYLTVMGTTDYIGEPISQLEHALQCAYFAEQSGHSDEVVFASLLHDIGHFASSLEQHQMADLGVIHHEWIGAKLAFELHFSPKVALLIGYHVDAKRYLSGKNATYYQRLSPASQQTLAYQGGPMDAPERLAFEQLSYFREILQVRVNDEKAKEIDLIVPGVDYYCSKIREHMAGQAIIKDRNAFPLSDFVNKEWAEGFKAYLHDWVE